MTYSFITLFKKECWRFLRVSLQTLLAPILSAILYQVIFAQVMHNRPDILPGVSYTVFLIPGLAMMSMLQNAFANASSSLILSRLTGNLIFIQLTPISASAFFGAYVGASIVRGILVGVGVLLATAWFGLPIPKEFGILVLFSLGACTVMGILGLIAGIVAEKFDQLAMFQNFLIMPLTFLSGVFYSVNSLPPFWQHLSRYNPLFYMIDGFRYGFFGVSDVSPWISLCVTAGSVAILSTMIILMLRCGFKLTY